MMISQTIASHLS